MASKKSEGLTKDEEWAIFKTLYHHPSSTPLITEMITGIDLTSPKTDVEEIPKPTRREKRFANKFVDEALQFYYANPSIFILEHRAKKTQVEKQSQLCCNPNPSS